MKRSAVVTDLIEMIYNGATGDDVMNYIEEIGMLPPARAELKSLSGPYETYDINNQDIPMIAEIIEVNKWDAE